MCPATEPASKTPGDANGDGLADVADAVFVREHVTGRGPAPWCAPAVDLVQDGFIELDDAFALLTWANEDLATLPRRPDLDCPGTAPPLEGDCAVMALEVVAPAEVSGGFEAEIGLVAPGAALQGWTLTVTTEGCTIVSVTTEGTAGGDAADGPPGVRELGYDATFARPRRATSTVLLGQLRDTVARGDNAVMPLLQVALDASPPAAGCGTCRLTVGEPARTEGQELATVLVAGSLGYAPSPVTAEISVCPL